MPFVKLDAGILRSTIWYKRPELEIFLTALLMSEPREYEEPTHTIEIDTLNDAGFVVPPGWYGYVSASGPGLISQALNGKMEGGVEALKALANPEAESRSQAFDGRRMVRIDGGYLVLNYMKYRDYDYNAADRMRKLRARRNGVRANVTPVHPNVTHAESREQKADSIPIPQSSVVDEIYQLYPKKSGKQAALSAIRKALLSRDADVLKEAVGAYAQVVATWPPDDAKYVPDPSTWFNKGKYDDDRTTWIRKSETHQRPNDRHFRTRQSYAGIKSHGLEPPA